jgi:SAM-dependent methyltransferase
MLATRELPAGFAEWNRRWGAPFGRRAGTGRLDETRLRTRALRSLESRTTLGIRRCGPFAWQWNSSLREFEYPWAFERIQSRGRPLTVVEIGGGMSGMQWVLARAGHRVVNVDPGLAARGKGWELSAERHDQISRALRAPVELAPVTLGEAGLEDASADVLLSISTIEHFAQADLAEFAEHARRILRPGGIAVLTIDLFLDLTPFTAETRNRYGTNVNVRELLESCGLALVDGRPQETYGFPDFDHRSVQADLGRLFVGTYPALSQCIVAEPVPG